jgi:hypothetical protein
VYKSVTEYQFIKIIETLGSRPGPQSDEKAHHDPAQAVLLLVQ